MQECAPGGLVFWSGLATGPSAIADQTLVFHMLAVKSLVVSHEGSFAVRKQFCKQLSCPDHGVVRAL